MRAACVVLVMCLAGLGWYATAASMPPRPTEIDLTPPDQRPWVRTRDGWQRATWNPAPTPYPPPLHPLVVATLLGFGSTLALLMFPLPEKREE